MLDCLCGHSRAKHVFRSDGIFACNWCSCMQYMQAKRMLMHICGLFVLLMLTGCTSLASLAETMNERKISSCIKWQGFVGGPMVGAQVQVQGITATGGATLRMCQGGE